MEIDALITILLNNGVIDHGQYCAILGDLSDYREARDKAEDIPMDDMVIDGCDRYGSLD